MPTVNMIVRLLCGRLEDTFTAKKAFYPDAPLITNNLILDPANNLEQNGRDNLPIY